ncbi:NAD(P)-dependent iron-only hydrogenase diaphorase component iron-sulfur protein [Clostridium frigidicarnis]|uniref:NAD(P)-dependent iron-only hydrogenase diaphorase component iron-sulfur protein n=2 Tax=Clostridium frigidicarnis TaxID=84698 RepID=A0A1I0W4U2_9CLOT|nr:NAD(P)-dependent iron-only hydrogenase diaphorase component iron-sulfur protein [Clostridium frigidicarnis]
MGSMCGNNLKLKELEHFILQQEDKESALIGVLHKAQGMFGYLDEEIQKFIADKLEIPVSKVYGVVTFYSYFTTEPKGKYVISVCTGTACFVRGAGEILEEFKKELNIKEGETTQDNLYTLDTLRCVGACGIAPVVSVNDKVYGQFTKSQVKTLLSELREQ